MIFEVVYPKESYQWSKISETLLDLARCLYVLALPLIELDHGNSGSFRYYRESSLVKEFRQMWQKGRRGVNELGNWAWGVRLIRHPSAACAPLVLMYAHP